MRLDLERSAMTTADVHGAGVLARTHHDPLSLRGQLPQQLPGVLVGAVLRPEQGEHRQLDLVRLPAEQLLDALVLVVGQPQLAVPSFGDGPHAAAGWFAAARNRASPSSDPVCGSTACSGCGIRPSTFPASLVTPAISRTLPLGL